MTSEIDETNEDPKYWNEILKKCGLSMNRGARPNFTTPVGGMETLMRAEKNQFRKDLGVVEPSGKGPDA